ncbi:MAG: hypothetical protein V4751_03450 [Pseudomonadota bacterium]
MPQTLTGILLEQGLAAPLLSDVQLARVVEGSPQRRYNLVNRALKSGELHRLRRGLYLLARPYRAYDCHPFAAAQRLNPGSYISLETALSFHGWIPEAVHVTASIVPGTKSSELEDSVLGRFSFHPLATRPGHFLELVARTTINHQTMLVAQPMRALLDLVCLRKQRWQGIAWLEEGLRIDPDFLRSVSSTQLETLRLVYKQKRMQDFINKLVKELSMEAKHD